MSIVRNEGGLNNCLILPERFESEGPAFTKDICSAKQTPLLKDRRVRHGTEKLAGARGAFVDAMDRNDDDIRLHRWLPGRTRAQGKCGSDHVTKRGKLDAKATKDNNDI